MHAGKTLTFFFDDALAVFFVRGGSPGSDATIRKDIKLAICEDGCLYGPFFCPLAIILGGRRRA